MNTKTLALITLSAAILLGAVATAFSYEAKPAASEERVDCELVITPKDVTVIKGGEFC